jgi:hypothetical protein
MLRMMRRHAPPRDVLSHLYPSSVRLTVTAGGRWDRGGQWESVLRRSAHHAEHDGHFAEAGGYDPQVRPRRRDVKIFGSTGGRPVAW